MTETLNDALLEGYLATGQIRCFGGRTFIMRNSASALLEGAKAFRMLLLPYYPPNNGRHLPN